MHQRNFLLTNTTTPLTLVLAAVAVLGLGCQRGPARIGVVLPLSGDFSAYGDSSRKGVELAWEVVQAEHEGDLSFELLPVVDSTSDPARAAEVLGEVYDGGAVAVIGGLTDAEARPMAAVAEDHERVLLSPSATDERLLESSRQVYSVASSDEIAGTTLGGFVARNLKVKRAVVLGDTAFDAGALEAGFRSALENQGGEILAVHQVAPGDAKDLAAKVREVRQLQPDAILLGGYDHALAAMVRELRRQAYGGQILTTQAFVAPGNLQALGKAAVDVLVARTVFEEDTSEQAAAFIERYREKYGEAPDVFAAEAYDAVLVMATAMEGRHALSSEVRKGLRDQVKDYPGVTGEIKFNEKGGVGKYPRVYSVAGDLSLRDHGKYLADEAERIRQKMQDLRDRLNNIGESGTSAGP